MYDLSSDECFGLLPRVNIGRIGMRTEMRGLLIQPVNFVVLDRQILFCTVPGTKLDVAERNTEVAFEADSYAPDGAWGWTVLIQGLASRVADAARVERGRVRAAAQLGVSRGPSRRPDRADTRDGRGFGEAVRAVVGSG